MSAKSTGESSAPAPAKIFKGRPWIVLGMIIAVGTLARAVSPTWGIWWGLAFFGSWTVYAWIKEKGNVVDTFRDWGLGLFILATAYGPNVNSCAVNLRETPEVGIAEVTKNIKLPEVNVNPAAPTTATVPPITPETPVTTAPAPAAVVAQGGAR